MARRRRVPFLFLFLIASGHTFSAPASAQPQELPPVEITGSAIRRTDGGTPIGLHRIGEDEIRRSGVASLTELLQALPEMQGFTTNSQSVNGGGGGGPSASLHAIGANYTLVLLNGRRIVPATSGSTVNLNILPLGAIERVEVLLDGASSIYGADAIAGVVNIVTKKDTANGSLDISASRPQRAGGSGRNLSIAKGFGDLDRDGFNAYLAFGAERQAALEAGQRSFSRTGFIPFTDAGQSLSTAFGSSYAMPGNVVLNDRTGTGAGDAFYSPAAVGSGTCPGKTRRVDGLCRFDYAATVEAEPETRRTSLYGSGRWKVGDALALFGETLLSDFESRARYAPDAESFYLTQTLVDRHVAPTLGALGIAPTDFYPAGDPGGGGPTANVRLSGAGGRANAYRIRTAHGVVGAEGSMAAVDYAVSLTRSRQRQVDRAIGGYLRLDAVEALIADGRFDPLATNDDGGSALDSAAFRDEFSTTVSTLDVARLTLSRDLAALPGGALRAAAGAEATRQRYAVTVDPAGLATGNGAGASLDTSRRAFGAFAEVVAPLTPLLGVTASVRRDTVGAVTRRADLDVGSNSGADATQGARSAATTYKLSVDWQPVGAMRLRASVGTGFKAPEIADIASGLQTAGVTGMHACPPGLPAALAAYCKPVVYEYNLRSGGNPTDGASALRPERSTQWTLGLRAGSARSLELGVALWQVALRQRIGSIPEDVAFDDGARYASAFSIAPDPSTGQATLTYNAFPVNVGKARHQGIDLDLSGRWSTPVGRVGLKASSTYLVRADGEIVGLPGYQSSLGKVGVDGAVVFRWQLQATAALETGRFVHTLRGTFKPSYADQVTDGRSGPDIRRVEADGTLGDRVAVARRVAPYALIDWQTRFAATSACDLTLGVRNVFDRAPPFSVADVRGTGNVRGFDARYTDPVGRALYLAAAYRF